MGLDTETATGVTTEIFTTEEVPERPPAVATALSAYEPAERPLVVKLKGALCTDPARVEFTKKDTFVTVPLLTVALAEIFTLAGLANTALLTGLVMVTVGAVAAGAVERLYATVPDPN